MVMAMRASPWARRSGGSVRSSMRSTVASASARAGRDREARACRGRRREAPDAAPRPPRGRSPRRAGRPARRLRRAARCRAAPPARRCRDGSWRSGRCRRPGAAGAHPRQGVAVRRAEDAPRRRAGRTLPAVDALPAARCRGRNPKLCRDRGTAQPRRLAKPLGLRPDLGRMRDQSHGGCSVAGRGEGGRRSKKCAHEKTARRGARAVGDAGVLSRTGRRPAALRRSRSLTAPLPPKNPHPCARRTSLDRSACRLACGALMGGREPRISCCVTCPRRHERSAARASRSNEATT